MTSQYTDDEKRELIMNLTFEVKHRAIQFRRELEDRLESMKMSQETLLSHIPKQVRALTMREFGTKYNGDIQAALRGLHREKFISERGQGALEKIDKDTRKRKWEASQETENNGEVAGDEKERERKTLKLGSPSRPLPRKGLGTPTKSRTLSGLPGSPFSKSPQKSTKLPFNASNSTTFKRPLSPSKLGPNKGKANFPSGSGLFNPLLSSKGPAYPGATSRSALTTSPSLIPGSPKSTQSLKGTTATAHPLKHARTGSQTSNGSATTDLPASTATESEYSSVPSSPARDRHAAVPLAVLQPSRYQNQNQLTPVQSSQKQNLSRSFSLTMAISSMGGKEQLISFDPLQTSPNTALAQLESANPGITESTKKQVKKEMGHLVREVVQKWKIE